MRVCSLILLISVCAGAADDVHLTPDERQSETAWLTSLGLKLPDGGLLLDTPFAQPFSNRSLLVPTAWWRLPSPKEVGADELRLDLPLLHSVMQKAYGGWTSAEQRGWDWNRWFADWDTELASKGSARMALPDALAAFGKLQDVQLDNHSGTVGLPMFQSGSRTAVLDAAPAGVCTQMRTVNGAVLSLNTKDPAQAPRKALVLTDPNSPEREGYYMKYPARRGIVAAVNCGGKWVPARTTWAHSKQQLIAVLAGRSANEPSYRMLNSAIGYLRLPSFNKQNGELLRALVANLPESAGHEKVLIVDLRANDGGDAPIDELARWIDLRTLAPALRGLGRRIPQSCLYTALRWGYSQTTIEGLKPPLSDTLRSALQQQLDGLFAPVPEGCPVTIEDQPSTWDYRQHTVTTEPPAGKPRLLVLVDNECGSDCEFLTAILAAEKGSVIAGENTFGVGQFIQPGYFILPNSRIKFRIALGMSDIYGDNRSVDGYGLDVDIVLPTEEAQSGQAILRLAGRLADAR
jgi:hypothetical protein